MNYVSLYSIEKRFLSKFVSKSIFCLFFLFVLSFSFPSYAKWNCGSGYTKESEVACTFGRCGICAPSGAAVTSGEDWANPKAKVIYEPLVPVGSSDDTLPTYKEVIYPGKCKWLAGVRFCARFAMPAVRDINGNQLVPPDPGNNTGNPGKPMLCAYEDPCDGMDPPDGNCAKHSSEGPYHENTPNSKAISVSGAATMGAVAGGAGGAAIGAMTAAIMQKFNHVVIHHPLGSDDPNNSTVGCIDRSIGPPPPAWSNNKWFNVLDPTPEFTNDTATSVFEQPVIKMVQCTDASGVAKIPCSFDAAGNPAPGAVQITPSPVITLNAANNFKACVDKNGAAATCPIDPSLTQDVYYKAEIIPDVVDSSDNKNLEPGSPGVITISMVANHNWITVTTLPRPGYIPIPTVQQVGTYGTDSQISISFKDRAGTPISLKLNECGVIDQVGFCAERVCAEGGYTSTTDTNGITTTSCAKYENHKLCAIGYKTAPISVVYNNSITTPFGKIDVPITFAPNQLVGAGVAVKNENANQENGDYVGINAPRDAFVKSVEIKQHQPTCKLASADGTYCANYDGTCADSSNPCTNFAIVNQTAADDQWYVDPSLYNQRPLNAEEAGLCVWDPYTMPPAEFYTPGDYTYTVPPGCGGILRVEVWGGGQHGAFKMGATCTMNPAPSSPPDSDTDYSGGSGGYTVGFMNNVAPGAKIGLHVGGAGGNSWLGSSFATAYAYAYGANTSSKWYQGAPKGGGSLSGIVASPGNSGTCSSFGTANGAAAPSAPFGGEPAARGIAIDPKIGGGTTPGCLNSGNKTNIANPYPGSGGCSGDDNGTTAGSWAHGGPGGVRVQCVGNVDLP